MAEKTNKSTTDTQASEDVKKETETASKEAEVKVSKHDLKSSETKEEQSTVSKKKKKKFRRQILRGQAHIQCTYNNTLISIADLNGAVLAQSSSGLLGFKGAKKATPFVATQVINDVTEKVKKYGIKELDVYVKGVGSGREASVRALSNRGFDLKLIKDVTPIPHNGCRPRRPRRV